MEARAQRSRVIIALVICTGIGALCTAEVRGTSLASTQWGPDQITWIAGEGSVLLLTVTGPNFGVRKRSSGTLSFRPTTEAGILPDGTYRFELREVVDPADSAALDSRPRRQSSRFRISGGAIEPLETTKPEEPSSTDIGQRGER